MAEFHAHAEVQIEAITRLTFQQWFTGRAAYFRTLTPIAPDLGEQAMRADYIADKSWWYLTYDPESCQTFAGAAAAATRELPTPTGHARSMRRGWLEAIDVAITSAARQTPSRQWATTLIPESVIRGVFRSRP